MVMMIVGTTVMKEINVQVHKCSNIALLNSFINKENPPDNQKILLFLLNIVEPESVIRCPRQFPYAFMWGTHCCKHELENNSPNGISECDGGPLSLNSLCCKDNAYQKCRDEKGCHNRRG